MKKSADQNKVELSDIREDFGVELTGDMNAAKLYETFQVAHDAKKIKHTKNEKKRQ